MKTVRWWGGGATALMIPALLAAAATVPGRSVRFEGATSEHRWELAEIDPALPSDWTGYEYLVLELRASSPQRFTLALISGRTVQRRTLQPLPNVWIRAAVPLRYYRQPNRSGSSLAAVGKVARETFWITTGGAYGPLDAVTALGVGMNQPLGGPTLEIRAVRLAREDPGSALLDAKPVVDAFGQWIPGDQPGRARDLTQLRTEWATEAAALAPGDYGWNRYGGYRARQIGRASCRERG